MLKTPSSQDPILNTLRKEKVNISIYLLNGIKLQGQIESFDQSCIILRNAANQIVYKHAIATIVSPRNVRVYNSFSPPHQNVSNEKNANENDAHSDEPKIQKSK